MGVPFPSQVRPCRLRAAGPLLIPEPACVSCSLNLDWACRNRPWLRLCRSKGAIIPAVRQRMTGLALTVKAIAVRLTLLDPFEFYQAGVMVRNVRPVLVPWSMISAATAIRADGVLRPALLLVNGDVLPLRLAPRISSPGESGTIKIIDDKLAKVHPGRHGKPRGHAPAKAPADAPGTLLRPGLPGQPVFEVYRHYQPRSWPGVIGIPVFFAPRGFVGGLSNLRALASFHVAIGDSWIGWRPHFARRWRVLHFSEVISVTKVNRYKDSHIAYCHLAIKRADGRGIELRESELCFGAAAALLPSLAGHPGLATDARDRLTWASKAEPMRERGWWGRSSYNWLDGPP
jgi:hypothetical protein